MGSVSVKDDSDIPSVYVGKETSDTNVAKNDSITFWWLIDRLELLHVVQLSFCFLTVATKP